MFLAEAVLICFMGAKLVGFQTKAKDLTIGWSLIIASVALVLAAILIWTSKFSVLFWITEVALLASFIILTIFQIMDVGTAFDILGSAAILALIRYGKFTKPYIGPITKLSSH
jgi:small multidrug resistance pump